MAKIVIYIEVNFQKIVPEKFKMLKPAIQNLSRLFSTSEVRQDNLQQ